MKHYTADRVEVVPGLVCYDNNLDVVVVGEEAYEETNQNTGVTVTWFRLTYHKDGARAGSCDGSRLSTTFRNYKGQTFRAPESIPLG